MTSCSLLTSSGFQHTSGVRHVVLNIGTKRHAYENARSRFAVAICLDSIRRLHVSDLGLRLLGGSHRCPRALGAALPTCSLVRS